MPQATRATILTLHFIIFVDLFQVSFVFPLLPKIVEGFKGGATEIGLLCRAAAIAEGLAAPYLGTLGDRFGRKPMLCLAIAGGALCSGLIGLVNSYPILIVARLCQGVCGGTFGVVMAYVADVTSEAERGKENSRCQAMLFAGLIVGPLACGYLNAILGYQKTCLCAAFLCIVNLICTVVFLPESSSLRENTSVHDASLESGTLQASNEPGAASETTEQRRLPCQAWLVCVSFFLDEIGGTAWETTGLLYMQKTFFDDRPADATLFFTDIIAVVGVIGFFVSMFAYEHLERCIGLKGVMLLGGTTASIGFTCMAQPIGVGMPYGKWWFFWSIQFLVFGGILNSTSKNTMITRVVPSNMYGKALGMCSSFGNVSKAIGPIIFGPIFEKGGGFELLPWYTCAVANMVATVMCLLVRLKQPTHEEATSTVEQAEVSATAEVSAPVLVRHLSRQTSSDVRYGGASAMACTWASRHAARNPLLRSQSCSEAGAQVLAAAELKRVYSVN